MLAWFYVEFGSTPAVTWVLYGVKPVVIAIVANAIWGLGRVVVRRWQTRAGGGPPLSALACWESMNSCSCSAAEWWAP